MSSKPRRVVPEYSRPVTMARRPWRDDGCGGVEFDDAPGFGAVYVLGSG